MNRRAEAALHAGLVVACAGAVYANSLTNGFAFDDVSIIADNDRVHQLTDLAQQWNVPYWPTFGQMLGLYRPLTTFLFAVQWHLAGGAPTWFHAVNLVMHAAACVLVLFYLRRLTAPAGALLGALLFAVHPVHTEAVANVVGQAELLAAIGVVGACLIHAQRPTGEEVGWGRRLALVACFAMALLTKESAIVLPALLVLGDVVQKRISRERAGLRRYAGAMAMPVFLLAATAAAYLVVRFGVLGAIAGTDAAPSLPFLRGSHRLLVAFRSWPEYLRLLVFPQDLSADYSPAVILPLTSLTPMAALGLLFLLATAALAALIVVEPLAGFPAAWLLVSILPVSNLFFPIGVVVAERTLYLPSVAVAAAVAFAWNRLLRALPKERAPRRARLALYGAAGVLLALLGVRSYVRNPDWHDTLTVIRSIARDHPESYRAHWALATSAGLRGDVAGAELEWQMAYKLWPDNSQMLAEWGAYELSRRRYPRAVELLGRAHSMHPFVILTGDQLAEAYVRGGRAQEAARLVREQFLRDGPAPHRFLTLALAYDQLGRWGDAATAWRAALHRKEPATWVEWARLSLALERSGRSADAAAALTTARAMAARVPSARSALDGVEQLIRDNCPAPAPGSRASAACPADPLAGWEVVTAELMRASPSARKAAPRWQ